MDAPSWTTRTPGVKVPADPVRDIAEHVGCALISLRLFQREQRPGMIESAIENLELAAAQLSEGSDDE